MLKTLGIILVVLAPVQSFPKEVFFPLDFFNFSSSTNFLKQFDLPLNINGKCINDLEEWWKSCEAQEAWALQMLDSIPKSIDGILIGHFHIPGHFDECVGVKTENFQGQHCMVTFKLNSSILPYSGVTDEPIPDGLFYSFGICLPSSCSFSDINKALPYINANPSNFFKISNLKKNDCSINDFPPLRTEDWVTLFLIFFLIVIAIASTYYEYMQIFVHKNDNPNQLLTSFSLYKNTKFLFKISQSSTQLKCLNGIRFFSMTWVILGHAYVSYMYGAPMNTLKGFEFMSKKELTPINNAFVSVDSFFFLSGLLVCLVFFRDISQKGSFDVPVAFIHRYLRLTPPFAFLMLIQATLVSRMGNGPFWKNNAERVENSCRNSWWSGLIYLQNYLTNNNMCLGQSWYLSADTQMFWISPLILYPMLFYPAIAPFFLILLILAAAFTNFAIAYVNELSPRMNFLEASAQDQFLLEYSPFHTRMASWLIGILTGYIICGIKAKKIRFRLSLKLVIIGWIICFSLLGSSLFAIVRFVDAHYSVTEAAFYLAFHRVGWALGLSWLVLACVSGYGGPINFFLSLDIFQPLGKLSYCNFLIHMTLQLIRIFESRVNQYIGNFEILYYYFGDLLLSFLISIPLCLLFELPFISIDRYFFQKLSIFPLPQKKNDTVDEKKTNSEKIATEDIVEKGIYNPNFKES